MAIDSEKKRRRAVGILHPNKVLPEADGAIGAEDRAALAGAYYAGTPVGELRSVKWTSSICLPCIGCPNAEVVLCVTPEKIAKRACPEQVDYQSFNYGAIDAFLSNTCPSRCGDRRTYTFIYDLSQLAFEEVLTAADIEGAFCKGCISQWVEDLVGNEPYVRDDGDDNLTFVSPHGCEYPFKQGGGANFFWPFLYGEGSDGDLVVSGNEILPTERNYFFNDLTINEGAILMPYSNAYSYVTFQQIFVNGTLTVNGTLHLNGDDGSPGVAGIGGAGGLMNGEEINPGDGGAFQQGGDGGDGEVPEVSPPADGDYPLADGQYSGGGLGGDGGDGGGPGGGSGATTFNYQFQRLRSLFLNIHTMNPSLNSCVVGGGSGGRGGGGGGAAGGDAIGGGGGGGGAAGGLVWIAARNVIIGENGEISANGGVGGDGADGDDGVSGDDAGGGGAGGGGGGGVVYLIHNTLIQEGEINVKGGVAGTPGAGAQGGTSGDAGQDGAEGNIYLLNMSLGEFV